MKSTRRKLVLLTALFLALCGSAAAATTGSRNICDSCACSPNNVAPVTVNCTCAKTKLLIVREQDAELLASVRELTLASCGFVSLPPSGLSGSVSLARVTVRDMKLFHYTTGLFPALESLSVEDVGELVLDGFGPANHTLRHLTLRRTTMVRLVKGTVTAAAPLRRVLFDSVEVEEIESGALDMVFVGQEDNGQAAADGFTVVDSTLKAVHTGGVSVRSGAVRILNSTLDDLAAGAIQVDDPKGTGGIRLSGNRFGAMAGDSVTSTAPARPDAGDASVAVRVDGNRFRALPADLQLFKSERPVEFHDNAVENVDLGRFLFGVGPAVRVSSNRFECDCDPRRISVLKLNQVFPGLLPDADSRFARLLADNSCREPADTTLAGYKELLVKEIACKGSNVTAAPPNPPQTPTQDTQVNNGGNAAAVVTTTVVLATAATMLLCSGLAFN